MECKLFINFHLSRIKKDAFMPSYWARLLKYLWWLICRILMMDSGWWKEIPKINIQNCLWNNFPPPLPPVISQLKIEIHLLTIKTFHSFIQHNPIVDPDFLYEINKKIPKKKKLEKLFYFLYTYFSLVMNREIWKWNELINRAWKARIYGFPNKKKMKKKKWKKWNDRKKCADNLWKNRFAHNFFRGIFFSSFFMKFSFLLFVWRV